MWIIQSAYAGEEADAHTEHSTWNQSDPVLGDVNHHRGFLWRHMCKTQQQKFQFALVNDPQVDRILPEFDRRCFETSAEEWTRFLYAAEWPDLENQNLTLNYDWMNAVSTSWTGESAAVTITPKNIIVGSATPKKM